MSPTTLPLALSPPSIFRLKFCVLVGQVGYLAFDWFSGLQFEQKHIWGEPSSSAVKWSYLLSRYGGFGVQLIYAIVTLALLSYDTVPTMWCQVLYGFVAVTWELLFSCVRLTLRRQTIPLFKHRPRLAIVLNVLMLLEASVYAFWTCSVALRFEVGGPCIIRGMPRDTVAFSTVRLMFFGAIWAVACMGWKGMRPVAWRVMVQNVSPSFAAIFVVFTSLLGTSHFSHLDLQAVDLSLFFHYFVGFTMLMVGIINCRLIRKVECSPAPTSQPANADDESGADVPPNTITANGSTNPCPQPTSPSPSTPPLPPPPPTNTQM